jgi:hypothetical protein
MSIEAMKQALEALEEYKYAEARTTLRQAIEQAEQAQPVTILPDGSAFAVMSYPLPKDHWLYAEREYRNGEDEPVELGKPILTRQLRDSVVSAVRYAVRGATNCGKEVDFDPDALVQNAVYALCGPHGQAIEQAEKQCQCPACKIKLHASDCAVHNEPAYPKGACDCGAIKQAEQYDQQALELCEKCGWKTLIPGDGCLNCMRAEKQEPVANLTVEQGRVSMAAVILPDGVYDLYTSPPQRQPLTDEQKLALLKKHFNAVIVPDWFDALLKDIEAAHGIKGEA